jgi:flagellar biosynthesis/type III secretory pathway protein FliH
MSSRIKRQSLKSRPFAFSKAVNRTAIDPAPEARRIIVEAMKEAERVRAEAQREAKAGCEAAHRRGYDQALIELAQYLKDANKRKEEVGKEIERDLLKLSIEIARQIVEEEIKHRSETLAEIIVTALRNARQHEMLTVRINPGDMEAIVLHRNLIEQMSRARYIDIVVDPRVDHGGCVIESDSGTIDAQLNTQLRVLERALLMRALGER